MIKYSEFVFMRGEGAHDSQAPRFVIGKGTHDNQASHKKVLKSYCNLHLVGPRNYNYCKLTTGVQIDICHPDCGILLS